MKDIPKKYLNLKDPFQNPDDKYKNLRDPFQKPKDKVKEHNQKGVASMVNITQVAKPILEKQLLNNNDLSDFQKRESLRFLDNPKEQEKIAKNALEDGKQNSKLVDQFKEGLMYFAPKILGLIGGIAAGDVEAGIQAGEEGMKSAGLWRSYQKEMEATRMNVAKQQEEMELKRRADLRADTKLKTDLANQMGVSERAEGQLALQRDQLAETKRERDRRFSLDKQKLDFQKAKQTADASKMELEFGDSGKTKLRQVDKDGNPTGFVWKVKGTNKFVDGQGKLIDPKNVQDVEQIRQMTAQKHRAAKFKYKIDQDAEMSDKQYQHLKGLERVEGMLEDAQNFVKDEKTGMFITPLKKTGKMFGLASNDFIDLDRVAEQLNSFVTNVLSGTAASPHERAQIRSWTVDLKLPENVLKRNIKRSLEEMREYREDFIRGLNETKDVSATKKGRKKIVGETMKDLGMNKKRTFKPGDQMPHKGKMLTRQADGTWK